MLRTHLQQSYQDSTNIGIPYIITYVNDEYIWYMEGVHSALATMFHLTTSVGQDYYGGSYLASSSGINGPGSLASFDISPNPASGEISLRFDINNNDAVLISVFNSQGQKVKSFSNVKSNIGMNSVVVDITDLSAGIYFAQVNNGSIVSESKKFIVTK